MRNLSDNDTAVENLKNNIEQMLEDVSLLRMSQYFIFNDSRKLKKQLLGTANGKKADPHWTEQV